MAKLRPIVESDMADIARLWEEFADLLSNTNPDYWALESEAAKFTGHLREVMNNPQVLVTVAEEDQQVIGFILAYLEKLPPWFGDVEIGLIRYLVVSEKCRGQRIGNRLADHAMDWFRSNGINRVEVYVLKGLAATDFWQKRGFKTFMDRRFAEL